MTKYRNLFALAGALGCLAIADAAFAETARSMVCTGPKGRYEVRYLPDSKVLFVDGNEYQAFMPPTPGVSDYSVAVFVDGYPTIIRFTPYPRAIYNSTDGTKTIREDACAPGALIASSAPSRSLTVIEIQTLLNEIGFDVGQPDGAAGSRTRTAIVAFQRSIGAPATGRLTANDTERLVETARSRTKTPESPPSASNNRSVDAPARSAPPPNIRFFRDCEQCPEMAELPKGKFMMGASEHDMNIPFIQYNIPQELPRHEVTINYTFAIGRFEVTVDEFDKYAQETKAAVGGNCDIRLMEKGPLALKYKGTLHPDNNKLILGPYLVIITDGSYRQPGLAVTGRQPATCVSRGEAKGYLQWLSAKTGRNYRLPTDAEWEYAVRAGTDTVAFWGNDLKQACKYANFGDRTSGYQAGIVAPCAEAIRPDWTSDVGSYKPNPWGLYDMLGNVQEMVEDCLYKNYEGAPVDGSAWTKENCPAYVARGGDYELPYFSMRSAERLLIADGSQDTPFIERGRANFAGFRAAVTLSK